MVEVMSLFTPYRLPYKQNPSRGEVERGFFSELPEEIEAERRGEQEAMPFEGWFPGVFSPNLHKSAENFAQGEKGAFQEKDVMPHMGYATWFTGNLKLDKQLAPHHLAYLQAFNTAQHVCWDVERLKNEPDPVREAVGLPLGEYGCYFTGRGFKDEYSYPPWRYMGRAETDPAYLGGVCPGTPDHCCDWRPNDKGTELIASADKFYGYIQWLQYLLDHFLIPWGYVLSGKMTWQGEENDDTGFFVVEKNRITVHQADPPS